jgi:hypothetical protein
VIPVVEAREAVPVARNGRPELETLKKTMKSPTFITREERTEGARGLSGSLEIPKSGKSQAPQFFFPRAL